MLVLTLLGSSAGVYVHAASVAQTPTLQPTHTILLTDPAPDPKQVGVQWFAPTGHTLRGSFLDYWTKYGGLSQFGYPTTEEFVEPVGGNDTLTVTVQYFQRNRFEHHLENQPPYDVLLGTLGRDFHTQDPPATPLPSSAQYFSETGHNLSGAFKQYWEKHGGLFVHGYPITEQYQEKSPTDGNTYLVQYFERSRFELHPENAGTPYEVLLGLLGMQSAQQKGYFSGTYPLYGHAVDFSWVSGRMGLYIPYPCASPDCGCAMFNYEENERHVQLDGYLRDLSRQLNAISATGASYLVIFGQLSNGPARFSTCTRDPSARGYMFSNVQLNRIP